MVQTIANKCGDLNCDKKIGSIFDQLLLFLQSFESNKPIGMAYSRREDIRIETNIEFSIF